MSEESNVSVEDPLLGKTIQERFRVEAKLGQGGMGAVYLAEHLLLKKKVALKVLHPGLATKSEVITRFKNEAIAASSIGHANIVAVLDMGRFEDGSFFMVLEYLEGRDWQEKLDEEGIQRVAAVAEIGVQVCAALEAASAKGIVHRDLKPENIFLTTKNGKKNFAKVLDFGISKILDGSNHATKTGQLMGTPYYMAPEQVLGEKNITHLVDIYALGVILFQALSATMPFEGEVLTQIVLKITTEPTPYLTERVQGVPDELVLLIASMMAKDASSRPQSFREVADRLIPFLSDESSLPVTIPRSPSTREDTNSTVLATPAPVTSFDTMERAPAAAAPERSPMPKWVPLAGAGGVLILGALIFGGDDAESEATAEPVREGESAEAEQEELSTVRIQVSTDPKDAALFLDGEKVSNPFDQELEKDERTHRFAAEKAGYERKKSKTDFENPRTLVLELEKKERRQPTKSSSSRGSGASDSSGSSDSGDSSGADSEFSEAKGKAKQTVRDIGQSIQGLF